MSLLNINIPISTDANMFAAAETVDFTGNRSDTTVSSISSGTDGNIRIVSSDPLTGIEAGDFISFKTDYYSPRNKRVVNVINSTTIEVDDVFRSTVSTGSFLNFKKDWYVEVRYVEFDSAENDQNAIPLFDFNTKIQSGIDASFRANVSLPAEKIEPHISLGTGVKSNLSFEYKIQYRESWKDNRSENWISYSPDLPIMVVSGTERVHSGFQDMNTLKRFVKGYPLIYSYIHSAVDDENRVNQVSITLTEYNIKKEATNSYSLGEFDNVSGVIVFNVDTSTFLSDTVFVEFSDTITRGSGDYHPDDYHPDDYKTTGT